MNNRHAELMSELLDLANDMILVKDFSGKIVFWNRGAERTYGFPREEALGKLSFELLQTEYPKSRQAVIDHLLVHGHWEGELVHHVLAALVRTDVKDGDHAGVTQRRGARASMRSDWGSRSGQPTLMATRRSRTRSFASKTWPMPPSPRTPRSS